MFTKAEELESFIDLGDARRERFCIFFFPVDDPRLEGFWKGLFVRFGEGVDAGKDGDLCTRCVGNVFGCDSVEELFADASVVKAGDCCAVDWIAECADSCKGYRVFVMLCVLVGPVLKFGGGPFEAVIVVS